MHGFVRLHNVEESSQAACSLRCAFIFLVLRVVYPQLGNCTIFGYVRLDHLTGRDAGILTPHQGVLGWTDDVEAVVAVTERKGTSSVPALPVAQS